MNETDLERLEKAPSLGIFPFFLPPYLNILSILRQVSSALSSPQTWGGCSKDRGRRQSWQSLSLPALDHACTCYSKKVRQKSFFETYFFCFFFFLFSLWFFLHSPASCHKSHLKKSTSFRGVTPAWTRSKGGHEAGLSTKREQPDLSSSGV